MPSPLTPLLRHRHAPALVAAVVGSIVCWVWNPPSTDLSVQRFRMEAFGRTPFAVWDNLWFGGHHTPSYSLLAPLLGSVLGAPLLGVLCTIGAAWIGSVLIHRLAVRAPSLRHPAFAAVLFALGCVASLLGGRTTFLMGVAFAVAALCSALDGPWWVASALGLLTAVASPVAGLLLALVAAGVWLARALPWRTSLALTVVPMLPVGLMALLFPEGGDFPFPIAGMVNTVLATAVVAVVGWRFRVIRWVCAAYAAFCVVCAVLPTPVGGNAARLGGLVAPAALVLLAQWSWRRTVVPIGALVALQWAPVSLAVTGNRDQTERSFYAPLLRVLDQQPRPLRVEVVPVASHDEANYVALHSPIARGWERQLDRKYGPLFYTSHFDAATFEQWLRDNGVTIVAIADTDLDTGGRREAELLAAPPAYLHEIHRDAVWRVFAVDPAPTLVDGDASLTSLTADSFALDVRGGGPVTVKVHFSPWFRITTGQGCVREGPGGWTIVDASAGTVRVTAELSLHGLVHRHGDC